MKISFVIPAYNESRNVGKCLKSVQAEIKRTADSSSGGPVSAEIVVVNNASTDKTREKALAFKGVTVVDEPLKGLVLARRAGFVVTQGELVANIDADTVLPEGWLTTVLEEFAQNPGLVALSGPFIYYDFNIFAQALVLVFYFFGWLFYIANHYVLGRGGMLQGGNFVLRRAAWEAAGGYDTTITFYGEDTDVARRISKQGEVLWTWRLPMYTSGRRLRKEGIIKTGLTYALNFFWISVIGRPYTRHYTDIRPE